MCVFHVVLEFSLHHVFDDTGDAVVGFLEWYCRCRGDTNGRRGEGVLCRDANCRGDVGALHGDESTLCGCREISSTPYRQN